MSRRNYKLYIDEQGNGNFEPFARKVQFPLSGVYVLDDTLDNGRLTVPGTTRSTLVKPFTRMRLDIYERFGKQKPYEFRLVESRYFCAISSALMQRKFVEPYKYDMLIETIELTKELERRTIDTMTVTKPLYHDYPMGTIQVPWLTGDMTITAQYEAIPIEKLPGYAIALIATGGILLLFGVGTPLILKIRSKRKS